MISENKRECSEGECSEGECSEGECGEECTYDQRNDTVWAGPLNTLCALALDDTV